MSWLAPWKSTDPIEPNSELSTLAPDIVEAIINGEEPDGLSLARLTRSFPEEWSEQRIMFGCEETRAYSLLLLTVIWNFSLSEKL